MIVDAWVNVWPARFAQRWANQPENESIGEMFGRQIAAGSTLTDLVATMDACGVDTAVLTGPLSRPTPGTSSAGIGAEEMLDAISAHPGRFVISAAVDDAESPTDNVRRIRTLAQHEHFVMVHITPLVQQYPLNHRLYYPVYAACEELQLPVSINIGVPGPKVRSACQDPVLLEDLLIDFSELTILGAHMGHPYEALLIQYMLKWTHLYLTTSAYLATYMDEALVKFMGSRRGRGRVLFASDHPVLAMERALEAAKALPLDPESASLFLGGSAERIILGRTGTTAP